MRQVLNDAAPLAGGSHADAVMRSAAGQKPSSGRGSVQILHGHVFHVHRLGAAASSLGNVTAHHHLGKLGIAILDRGEDALMLDEGARA